MQVTTAVTINTTSPVAVKEHPVTTSADVTSAAATLEVEATVVGALARVVSVTSATAVFRTPWTNANNSCNYIDAVTEHTRKCTAFHLAM